MSRTLMLMFFPDDLIIKIIMLLPVRPLLRFKCKTSLHSHEIHRDDGIVIKENILQELFL
ncbi:hypothetical protein RYX36_002399 [Vicia faba]